MHLPPHQILKPRCPARRSDCDEELLIHVAFAQRVRLNALQIRAPKDSGPAHAKLYINEQGIDFDSAKGKPHVQEVELHAANLLGNEKVELRAPLYAKGVDSVTLLIERNLEECEETVIESLALWGSVIEVKGLDPRLRGGLPKWQSDSGCDAFDKGR